MRIGVDEIVDHDLPQVDVVEPGRHLGAVDAGLVEGREIADLQIAHVLEGQGARRALGPVHFGDQHSAVGGEVFGEALGVASLGLHVELAAGGGDELVDHAVEVDAAADELEDLEAADRQPYGLQVGLHQDLDARAQHLDHRLLAAPELGRMDLGERGGADRPRIEPGEDLLRRPAEVLLDLSGDGVEGRRGHLVLQAAELVGDLARQEVHPRAQELAELDQHPALLHRQGAEAPRDARPARHRGPAREAQHGSREQDVPPHDVGEDAGEESQELTVTPGIDACCHEGDGEGWIPDLRSRTIPHLGAGKAGAAIGLEPTGRDARKCRRAP